MSHYFFISTGLRGAYMPDNGYVVKVDSRRELKKAIQWEFDTIKDAGFIISHKEMVSTVADIWRNLKAKPRSPYSFVVPYGWRNITGHGVNKCNAIHINHATRRDYLEQEQ